jgi:GNAT superfamily N-acetyltransferase
MVVVQTSLEMRSRDELRPARRPGVDAQLVDVDPADHATNLRLYAAVGAGYGWTDRLVWETTTWERWCALVLTRRLVVDGEDAGFFELGCQARGTVEILIFGLLPAFHGRGLGGWMLTEAIEHAWDLHPAGTRRVWVHTRTLDAPGALPNYLARGMQVFDRLIER